MLKTHHHDARTELLATIPLFKTLRRRQLDRITSLMTEVDVPAGRVLCEEGRRGDEFFLMKAGEVEVSNGARLGRGEYFGEMALVSDQPRSATVTTTQPTTVLVLSRQEFGEIRRIDPKIAEELERTIRARQAQAAR